MAGIRGFTSWVGVVLDGADPVALARFYSALLGWEVSSSDPTWVTMAMRDPDGRTTSSNLAFQLEEQHVRPVWPAGPGDQQMQMHLDIGVRELGPAVEDALALGARSPGCSRRTTCGCCSTPTGTRSASTSTAEPGRADPRCRRDRLQADRYRRSAVARCPGERSPDRDGASSARSP